MTAIANGTSPAHPRATNVFTDAATVGVNLLAIAGTHSGVVLCQVGAQTQIVLDNGATTENLLNVTSLTGPMALNIRIAGGTAVYVNRVGGSPGDVPTFLSWV